MTTKDLLDAGDIGRNIHGDAAVLALADADAIAIFEPAQLLELLEVFELSWRERGKFQERVAAEGVNADVLEMARGDGLRGISNPGNRSAPKIESIAVEIRDDFHDVRVHDFRRLSDGNAERGHLNFFIGGNRFRRGVNHFGRNERFISLDVNINFGWIVDGDFGDAFRAGTMVTARHDSFAAEGSDGGANALIVGGDEDSGNATGLAGAFDNMLDHRLASNGRQRFAREAGRIVASRDDSDNFRVFCHKFLRPQEILPCCCDGICVEAVVRLLPDCETRTSSTKWEPCRPSKALVL